GVSRKEAREMTVLLREAIGDRLRYARTNQSRTLRDISRSARVSLGYLSEVERGQKEASSELLASICEALDISLGQFLGEVAIDISALNNVELGAVNGEGQPVDPAVRSEYVRSEYVTQPAGAENEHSEFRGANGPHVSPSLRQTISSPKLSGDTLPV